MSCRSIVATFSSRWESAFINMHIVSQWVHSAFVLASQVSVTATISWKLRDSRITSNPSKCPVMNLLFKYNILKSLVSDSTSPTEANFAALKIKPIHLREKKIINALVRFQGQACTYIIYSIMAQFHVWEILQIIDTIFDWRIGIRIQFICIMLLHKEYQHAARSLRTYQGSLCRLYLDWIVVMELIGGWVSSISRTKWWSSFWELVVIHDSHECRMAVVSIHLKPFPSRCMAYCVKICEMCSQTYIMGTVFNNKSLTT